MQLTVSQTRRYDMSSKSAKYLNLSDIVGANNMPITANNVLSPEVLAITARRLPMLEKFFSSAEGQEIAKREGWTTRQKLTEAFRILREREVSSN